MDSNELFDKLKSMGVQLGGKQVVQQKPRQSPYSIENVVKGEDLPTMHGLAFITQEQYTSDYRHGEIPLCLDREMDILAAWSNCPRIMNGGNNVVFLDTETSGLAGGTGTYVFLVGIGYRTATGFELVQFFMRDPGQEAALLAGLYSWLTRFDTVVTFNGKTFDVPLLNTRYTLNGMASPFVEYQHVDVLHIARKLWRDRLPSRALGELEKEIVRFRRTTDDIPGWMIPELYFDYLRNGDARPLAGVFYHNAVDILSLACLYGHVAGMLKDPLREAAQHGLDLAAIARLYEEMGKIEQAAELYERSLEQGLPEDFYLKTMERFAQMRRRQGEWEKAAQLWRKAAEHGECSACIELAKYYEHRERNYTEALQWAQRAYDSLGYSNRYLYTLRAQQIEIQKRIDRLRQRVNASSSNTE